MSRAIFLALCLVLAGCGPAMGPPSVRLALDGPPLLIAVDKNGLRGAMDRGCMAGFGAVSLLDAQRAVTCTGEMDHPADEKARLRVELTCDNGETIAVTMRNLGPDQGMGVGRITETGELLLLFYHPSVEEAERRLAQIKGEIERALADKAAEARGKGIEGLLAPQTPPAGE